ncbi:MAG: DUF2461 domain-containing protein [Ferruginibacter sp.]
MLAKNSLRFLTELHLNNNRAWFEENRLWYEETKQDFEKLVAELISEISGFDKDIAELQVKNCTFRQYRDVRFSKDKRPYKINMGAYFNKGGKKINTAGYYFHLEPGKSMLAGGLWMPEALPLSKIRQEIDYNYNEWLKIINKSDFKRSFPGGLSMDDSLKRPPKGYEIENPGIQHLKLKSFIARQPLNDSELTSAGLKKHLAKSFKILQPMISFLNRASE